MEEKKEKKEKSLFVKCQCSTHCFQIEKSVDDWLEGFDLTFWNLGRTNDTLCWRERFRWVWNIFRTGQPWADGIIISNEQAKEISEYINKHLQKE
jgi:hypothetical protein